MEPVAFVQESELLEKERGKRRTVAELNAALGEGCPFHYELCPAVKEVAVGENAVDKVVVVDHDAPPVLMLVFNNLRSSTPLYIDGRILSEKPS
jgi:hypothetical protein